MKDKRSLSSGAISQFCYFYFPRNKVKIDNFGYPEQISNLIPFPRDI